MSLGHMLPELQRLKSNLKVLQDGDPKTNSQPKLTVSYFILSFVLRVCYMNILLSFSLYICFFFFFKCLSSPFLFVSSVLINHLHSSLILLINLYMVDAIQAGLTMRFGHLYKKPEYILATTVNPKFVPILDLFLLLLL